MKFDNYADSKITIKVYNSDGSEILTRTSWIQGLISDVLKSCQCYDIAKEVAAINIQVETEQKVGEPITVEEESVGC